MSTILAETVLAAGAVAQATMPAGAKTEMDLAAGAIILGMMLVGLVVFIAARAWNPARVCGPIRHPLDRPATRPVILGIVATGIYLGTQVLAGVLLIFLKARSDEALDLTSLRPEDFALIATIPGLVAAAVLFLLAAFMPDLGRQLGTTTRQIPRGVVLGMIGSAVAIPLVFGSSMGFERLYKALNYAHPQEHQLLAMLLETRSWLVRLSLIAGAVIVAPLVEELVFRGFIQSALTRVFSRKRYDLPSMQPVPVAATGIPPLPELVPTAIPAMVLPYPTPPVIIHVDPPTALARWAAIVLTSLVFAALHPMWSWPMIFLLSLCLGYAYERTGNLWASVTIHLLFNGISTAVFLTLRM